MNGWTILYRGPLSSCNYGCDYCPFAKTENSREELLDDARKLARFVAWVGSREETIGVLFTPWGEALFHSAYQEAITQLSHFPNVRRVAIQTNLSCKLDWLENCDARRVALWATYHPTETPRAKFLAQCAALDRMKIRHSVGTVGSRDQIAEIRALRESLNPDTYLWVNARKREPDYYASEDLAAFEQIDALFPINARHHPSKGRACLAGETAFTVDGDGDMRRCHFIKERIGNIYEPAFEQALVPRNCVNDTCGCHIGYVHLKELNLYPVFGEGLLERIPAAQA